MWYYYFYMEHKYYLGVDGGGTKTAFALINEQKELIYLKEDKFKETDRGSAGFGSTGIAN